MRGVVPNSLAVVAVKKKFGLNFEHLLNIACYISSMNHSLAPVAPVVVGSPQACTLMLSTRIGILGFSGMNVISIDLTLGTSLSKTNFPCCKVCWRKLKISVGMVKSHTIQYNTKTNIIIVASTP